MNSASPSSPVARQPSQTAGAVSFDIHVVTVEWDGQARDVEADAAEVTPLVGMRLLAGHDLHVEVENGGRVVIEAR